MIIGMNKGHPTRLGWQGKLARSMTQNRARPPAQGNVSDQLAGMATIPEAATRHGSYHCSRSRAPVVVGQVFATIRRLREQGLTILLVEQNLKQALEVADRGYVVETGRVALRGSRAELLDDPAVRAVYLGI